MRNYKPKAARGLCAWYGCQKPRGPNGLCAEHQRQLRQQAVKKKGRSRTPGAQAPERP